MGLVIDSPRFCAQLAQAFDAAIPAGAYEVRLAADGDLEWIERKPSGETRYTSEPGMGPVRRAFIGFLSLLPIDWLL